MSRQLAWAAAAVVGLFAVAGCGGGEPRSGGAGTASSANAEIRLAVAGMTCGSCATTARLALQRTAGVMEAAVSWDSSSAVVRYDSAATDPATIIAALTRTTGYTARIVPRPDEAR